MGGAPGEIPFHNQSVRKMFFEQVEDKVGGGELLRSIHRCECEKSMDFVDKKLSGLLVLLGEDRHGTGT
jgi:hypothetical protein